MKSEKDLSEHLVRKGDKIAFEMFYRKHFKSLIAYLRMFVTDLDLTKDIAQQSFVKLWLKRTAVPTDIPLKRYLFAISKNLYIDYYRAQKRENETLEQLKLEALEHLDTAPTESLTHRSVLLKQAINELPPKCREVLLMSKMEGLPYKQIALRLDISVKTVESQMRIAYTKIRVCILDMEDAKN